MKILYKLKVKSQKSKVKRDSLFKLKVIILLFFIPSLLIAQVYSEKDIEICKDKFKLAGDKNLGNKPIGDIIVEIGESFIGTDYAANTLEKGEKENLVINLTGLDCTTFIENTLALARCIKQNKTTFKDYQDELKRIRYRDGIINGYPSRLNYFSDWIYNNEQKGIIKDATKEIGGKVIKFNVDYMSKHSNSYKRLKENPKLIPIITGQEKEIAKREYYFIPKDHLDSVESKIQDGDIIAMTSNVKGLDINHVGIAIRTNDRRVHLLNAPNVGYKVQISKLLLSDYLKKNKKDTGIIVLRVLNPMK